MNRDLVVAGAGLAAGVVLTVLVMVVTSAVWGDGGAGTAGPPVAVHTPTVPPPPTALPTLSTTTEDPEVPEDWSTEDDGSGEDESEDSYDPAPAPPLVDAAPAGEGPLPDASRVRCPAADITVGTAEELAEALATVTAGQTILLGDGTYAGQFATTVSGTARQPIFLCGGAGAVLDGGDVEDGYVLHLDGAQHWRLVGFTVTNGQKGVMTDGTTGTVIQDLTVTHIGDEAIHLRNDSTDNVVLGNTISDTGLRRDKYGEGIYVGTSVSNWCSTNSCRPDRSDRNVIKGNTITDVSSEAIDVKEATTGGLIVGNTFDGSAMTGADSWVDVKGNNWLIADNHGENAPVDGFQTHELVDGWGDHNVFRGNTAIVNGPGMGFSSWPMGDNVVTCDNTVVAAEEGFSNIPCT